MISQLKTNPQQFIALSGTLGVGLYVQGGTILHLGGPWALVISFALMSVLAWSVMQGLAEMLCIWPISGALYEYVSVFVDPEVGEAVGIAYWFTNAIGFAAIMMVSYFPPLVLQSPSYNLTQRKHHRLEPHTDT